MGGSDRQELTTLHLKPVNATVDVDDAQATLHLLCSYEPDEHALFTLAAWSAVEGNATHSVRAEEIDVPGGQLRLGVLEVTDAGRITLTVPFDAPVLAAFAVTTRLLISVQTETAQEHDSDIVSDIIELRHGISAQDARDLHMWMLTGSRGTRPTHWHFNPDACLDPAHHPDLL